jgi:hypothetical protein
MQAAWTSAAAATAHDLLCGLLRPALVALSRQRASVAAAGARRGVAGACFSRRRVADLSGLKEGRSSFLKKRSKKLLLAGIRGPSPNGLRMPRSKNFLVLFFKKEQLPFLHLPSASPWQNPAASHQSRI